MKKIPAVLAILLALVMFLSLSACAKEEPVENVVVLTEVPVMAEPVIKPELLGRSVAENLPELAPESARCCRMELLDGDMAVFR